MVGQLTTGMSLATGMRQSQILAPHMRQGLDILQMTALDLRTELQHQMAQNPVIEAVESRTERQMSAELPDEHASGAVSERELDFSPTGERAQETLSCDDAERDYYLQNLENYHASSENGSVDPDAQSRRQVLFDRQVRPETLQEHLLKQVELSEIPETDHPLARLLIEYIDDDGYFRGAIPDIVMVTGADEPRILRTLALIADFDPLGCGGRDLRECLSFQMEKLDGSPWRDAVRTLINGYLDKVAAHQETFLCERLGIAREDYPKVLAALRQLNPKPGLGFSAAAQSPVYVRPEVFVTKAKSGKWIARVTDRDLPTVRISKKYLAMLADPKCPKETRDYIRERLEAAKTLIESIKDRQETIENIAQEIVDAQTDVFEQRTLTALRPLTQEQIAQKVGVHNSTVSRTVRDKYMSTPLGVLEMSKFFTAGAGVKTASGEVMTTVAVKERLRALIAAEDKANPLSDEALSKALNADGIQCARRTVAKYRESIGIPGVSERRIR